MRLKKQIKDDFTSVHNEFLRNPSLSIAARGLLITMLSFKDDWNFSIKGLSAILKCDGERKISSALKELEEQGYLVRIRECDKTGKVTDWIYVFSDEPLPEETLKKSFKSKKSKTAVTVEPDDTDNHDENSDPEAEDDYKAEPECSYPHLRNADVAYADVENPHLEKPHVKNRSNNKYTNNQISKKEISSDYNINLSNHEADESADGFDEMDTYKQVINERICYDSLMFDYEDPDCRFPGTAESLKEIRDIMVECVCSKRKTIRVRGEDIPQERVSAVMLNLNSSHIQYVMECMQENSTNIKNIRAYLITALYNAPQTMSSYYAAKANNTLYGESSKNRDELVYASTVKPLFR